MNNTICIPTPFVCTGPKSVRVKVWLRGVVTRGLIRAIIHIHCYRCRGTCHMATSQSLHEVKAFAMAFSCMHEVRTDSTSFEGSLSSTVDLNIAMA